MSCTDIPEYDFSLFKGDDKTKQFRYKAAGVVVDISGYVIQLETNVGSLDKTATISDPLTGEFEFTFDRVDTEALTQRRVKYKVVFYPTGLIGSRITKFGGSINLNSKGIT
tara:strand:- start:169 stop:501 length:333 start_codon:yes stop_codon:yes gene_type:complete